MTPENTERAIVLLCCWMREREHPEYNMLTIPNLICWLGYNAFGIHFKDTALRKLINEQVKPILKKEGLHIIPTNRGYFVARDANDLEAVEEAEASLRKQLDSLQKNLMDLNITAAELRGKPARTI